ncbi:hypothetical protein GDO81_004383 [Engystomops pustulosus]|uniref:Uncharacterized protein n=1 Tax=Engystomops pustulosus TaxID=76066 RepID=A0AAV6ZXM8_ENGPU|nr:hypothetical protein GDO81_004383 [Engystomops pustulosus]
MPLTNRDIISCEPLKGFRIFMMALSIKKEITVQPITGHGCDPFVVFSVCSEGLGSRNWGLGKAPAKHWNGIHYPHPNPDSSKIQQIKV